MDNNIEEVIAHGHTPETLSKLITNAICDGQYKTKGDVRKCVEQLIKVFINTKPLSKEKHQLAMRKEQSEKLFWQRKIRSLHPDEIDKFYAELDEFLISRGLYKEKKAS